MVGGVQLFGGQELRLEVAMHVHPMNQAMPMQQLVETKQTQAAREAETRRKLSLFLIGGGEEGEAEGRSRGRYEREGSPRREKEEDGEFAHVFSVKV